jgi:hypothetical protein
VDELGEVVAEEAEDEHQTGFHSHSVLGFEEGRLELVRGP